MWRGSATIRHPRSLPVHEASARRRVVRVEHGRARRLRRGCRCAALGSPTVVADGIDARSRPTLAFTGDGHAVATLSGTANGLTRVLRAEPGSAAFRHVGEARMLAAPAPYGRDGVAYLLAPAAARSGLPIGDGQRPASASRWRRQTARWVVRTRSLACAPPRATCRPRSPAARAAISRSRGCSRWAVAARCAWRCCGRPDADSPRPRRSRRPLTSRRFALAYGDRGDLVLAFARSAGSAGRLDIAARVTRADGRVRPVRSLGPTARDVSLAAAVSPHCDAVVAWGTQDAGAETTPWTLHAALAVDGRLARRQRFGGRKARGACGSLRRAHLIERLDVVVELREHRVRSTQPPLRSAVARRAPERGRGGPVGHLRVQRPLCPRPALTHRDDRGPGPGAHCARWPTSRRVRQRSP